MWTPVDQVNTEEGKWYDTCIKDSSGIRNEQRMMYRYKMWWDTYNTYVYYQPTHIWS